MKKFDDSSEICKHCSAWSCMQRFFYSILRLKQSLAGGTAFSPQPARQNCIHAVLPWKSNNSLNPMNINITVVTHNRLDLTKICLQSLLEKTKGKYRLTLIDNASHDGTKEYINNLSNLCSNITIFFLRTNMGVAVAANLGWANFDADYYVKLDNDIEICDNNWLEQLVDIVENNKNIAMSGYLLSNWKCKKEYIILQSGDAFISSDMCNGGCVIIPRHIHEKLGFWIEDHGKYGYEDKNYSDRAIAAGYIVGYIPGDILPVRHIGFEEGHIDTMRESAKKQNIEEKYFGEHLYVFNKLLFDNGIRKLYVDRRYLPEFSSGNVRFTLNPAYIPIIKIQQRYLDKIRYQGQDDTISVDLSRIP